ncbi:NusG domain II-containing protein [Halarsenatibacter silvermanii]|uniref:Uncharacterized protein n=1 Tax=Halarsenatibacter silvermanii TaxID=321763 RepID=A0A1G9H694_9FIRM|nr:NusG domain II-containing protein [Halarsenatibacter silvermanii]SDL08506.1 hypothetical protein SAMN04488692_101116 [Halarsenatibacter silvermanii]
MNVLSKILKKMTRTDIVLVVLIVVLSLAGIIFPLLHTSEEHDELQLVIEQGGEEILRQEHPYQESGVQKIEFSWESEEYVARLEHDGSRVRLKRLEKDVVPLPIHVDMGWIEEPGEMIVALPVQMVVELEGDTGERELDGVSGTYN